MPDATNIFFDEPEGEQHSMFDLEEEYQEHREDAKATVQDAFPEPDGVKSLYAIPEHVLLRDPRSVPPSKAVKFMGVLGVLNSDDGVTPDQMSDLLAVFEKNVVVDNDGYMKLYRDKGLRAVLDLLSAWVGELVGD